MQKGVLYPPGCLSTGNERYIPPPGCLSTGNERYIPTRVPPYGVRRVYTHQGAFLRVNEGIYPPGCLPNGNKGVLYPPGCLLTVRRGTIPTRVPPMV